MGEGRDGGDGGRVTGCSGGDTETAGDARRPTGPSPARCG